MRNQNGAPRSLQAERGALRWNDRAMQYITAPVTERTLAAGEQTRPRWQWWAQTAAIVGCALLAMAGGTGGAF